MARKINVDMEAAKQDEKQREEERSSFEMFELKEGANSIRLLPRSMKIFSEEGDKTFAHRYLVHYRLFKAKGFGMIVCPKSIGAPCPICDFLETDEGKALLPDGNKPSERFLYNVVDVDRKSMTIWETGPGIYNDLVKYWLDPDWGPNAMISPEEGMVCKITFTPKDKSQSGWNNYDTVMAPRKIDVTAFLPEDWEKKVDDLEKRLPKIKSNEAIVRLVEHLKNGTSPVDDETEAREDVWAQRKEELTQSDTKKDGSVTLAKGAQEKDSPKEEAAPKEEIKEQATPQPAAAQGDGIPDCFGQGFSPRNGDCIECKYKVKCRTAFLKGD